VFFNQPLNPIKFNTSEASALLQSHRFEPELGFAPVALDVNMRRFVTVTRVKEKTIRPDL
jgi:hypothetical protein